jgi:hypothetical protein
MSSKGVVSERFAHRLQSVGMDKLAAFLLDAAGPLTLFSAQILFLIEPLLQTFNTPVGDLARLLEDPTQVSALVERLREEGEK